ncbi:Hpt domain-containing response regulator [Cecembia lonarensis]|uniref:Polar-differentiation response regulator divK n=1 Tax=Cecembia lonarensis (strain CCUG 58316 / KCTC 22772 / LW9) TaxID=1225176 RepID=K1L9I6_CECL9|nr:response regulator [Cecembia lonarensis]EKB51266.1 Polar-differentiation response regulator divK [Cecembia lonarensis LW9]
MKNKKILIADDNALNRKVFQNIIGQVYDYDLAENGHDVIEKIKSNHYDLILLDIQMPKLDGINTLRLIKEEKLTNAPIIAVSAFAEINDKAYFFSAGFDDFISKPIKPKQLLESLHQLISKSPENAPKDVEQNPTHQTEVLDKAVLIKLLKFNSKENIKLVYNDFIEETEKLLEEIEYLLKYGEVNEIGSKLHIIKGNSGTLGANSIYEFSKKIELDIKTDNFNNTLKDYLYLKTLFEQFKQHCQSSEFLNS